MRDRERERERVAWRERDRERKNEMEGSIFLLVRVSIGNAIPFEVCRFRSS